MPTAHDLGTTAQILRFPRPRKRARRAAAPVRPTVTLDALLAMRGAVIRELGNDHRACAALIRQHGAESFEEAVMAEARDRLVRK